MKILLITISLFAATLTANAHCGGCGTGEKAPSQDKAAKSCCSESGSCCSEKKACSDDKKSCDIKEKSCGVSEAASSAAKPTIPMPKMSCCPADA